MSDPHGPIWIVNAPATPYPDDRFDGVTPRAHWNPDPDDERVLASVANEYWPETPPLNPQQPTPEQIADAARETVKEIETVLRGWPFPTVSPLPKLRALYALLAPPAPQWQAKEDPEP